MQERRLKVFRKRQVAQHGCTFRMTEWQKIRKILAHKGKCVLLESLDFSACNQLKYF